MKRYFTYLVVVFSWIVLSLTGFFFIKDRLDLTWNWLIFSFGIILCLNSYVRKNGQIVIGLILAITFGAISLLNAGVIDFPRWQLWSIFFCSIGLGLIVLWTRRFLGSWILLPGAILLFAGGVGFGEDNWWRYQRTLRDMVDLWPVMLIFMLAVILIKRNFRREQKQYTKLN